MLCSGTACQIRAENDGIRQRQQPAVAALGNATTVAGIFGTSSRGKTAPVSGGMMAANASAPCIRVDGYDQALISVRQLAN